MIGTESSFEDQLVKVWQDDGVGFSRCQCRNEVDNPAPEGCRTPAIQLVWSTFIDCPGESAHWQL